VSNAPLPASIKMVRLLEQLAPNEGYTQSALDSVRLMRSDRPLGRTPVFYEPSIVIVCQGRKLGFLGDEVYIYDAQHYLVLSVPLPFSTETQASPEEPMLAVSIRLDLLELSDLITQIGATGRHSDAPPAGIASTPLAGHLAGATVRLLEVLTDPLDALVLGPGIVREICYRVLTGEQGGAMRAALTHHGRFGRVARTQADSRRLRHATQRRGAGRGGGHERAGVSRQLPHGDADFAHSVHQVDPSASGAPDDDSRWRDRRRSSRTRRLRKRVPVQPGVQAPLWAHAGQRGA